MPTINPPSSRQPLRATLDLGAFAGEATTRNTSGRRGGGATAKKVSKGGRGGLAPRQDGRMCGLGGQDDQGWQGGGRQGGAAQAGQGRERERARERAMEGVREGMRERERDRAANAGGREFPRLPAQMPIRRAPSGRATARAPSGHAPTASVGLGSEKGGGREGLLGRLMAKYRARREDKEERKVERMRMERHGGNSEMRGAEAGSGKITAASSLGSLQSYAMATVKDSGPLQSCFRSSTSEAVVQKRFVRIGEVVGDGEEIDGELVFNEDVRRNGLLSERPEALAYPKFALGEYGSPDSWSSDVFVLVHNAVRWEMMDLFTILGSLQRRWLIVTMSDVYDVAEFWELFELFVGQMFEVEDQIVFPYMLGQAASSKELTSYYTATKYSKEKLMGMMYDIGATIEMYNTQSAGEVFPKMYRDMMTFLPSLLEYMETQDSILPSVFVAHCHPEDRIMLNRAVANFLIRAAQGRDAIALLTRWIEDTMTLQIWKDENLSSRAKSSHSKWIKRLDTTHTAIARRQQRKLRSGGGIPASRAQDQAEAAKRAKVAVAGGERPDRVHTGVAKSRSVTSPSGVVGAASSLH